MEGDQAGGIEMKPDIYVSYEYPWATGAEVRTLWIRQGEVRVSRLH